MKVENKKFRPSWKQVGKLKNIRPDSRKPKEPAGNSVTAKQPSSSQSTDSIKPSAPTSAGSLESTTYDNRSVPILVHERLSDANDSSNLIKFKLFKNS